MEKFQVVKKFLQFFLVFQQQNFKAHDFLISRIQNQVKFNFLKTGLQITHFVLNVNQIPQNLQIQSSLFNEFFKYQLCFGKMVFVVQFDALVHLFIMGNSNQINQLKAKNVLSEILATNQSLKLKKLCNLDIKPPLVCSKRLNFQLELPFDINGNIQIENVNEKLLGFKFSFDSKVKLKMSLTLLQNVKNSVDVLKKQSYYFNPRMEQKFELSNFMFEKTMLVKKINQNRPKSSHLR